MVRELSQEELNKFNSTQGNIVQNIQDIQNIEIELYKELEANVSKNGSKAERDIYLARIEKLSEIRMDMYKCYVKWLRDKSIHVCLWNKNKILRYN